MADDFSRRVVGRQEVPQISLDKSSPGYQSALEELKDMKRSVTPTKQEAADIKPIAPKMTMTEIQSQLPSQAQFNRVQDKIRKRKTAFQGGFGQNLLDEQQIRLGRLMKRRNVKDTEENREKVLNSLLATVRTKKAYNPNNFLYNPDEEDAFDDDAMNILHIWSMQNLSTEFQSPEALFENLGSEDTRQTELRDEAAKLLREYSTKQAPDHRMVAVMGGEEVGQAYRFGEAVDDRIAEIAPDDLTRSLYAENLPHDLLRLAALGNEKNQDLAEVAIALGNEADAKHVIENAYFSRRDALPSDIYIPKLQTPDGRVATNMRTIKAGLENAIFRAESRKRGYERNSKIPKEEADEIRQSSRKRAKRLLEQVRQHGTNIVAWDDPDEMRRDYIEGRGLLAGTAKVLEVAASVGTLGLDEYLGDIPDKTIRAGLALFLPRAAAGKLTQGTEDLGYVRRPEFFGTLMGDTAITNAADYFLRLDPVEFFGASFKRAREDYAHEGGDFKGRPGGVWRNIKNNYGEASHIDTIVSSDDSVGRLMFEFGDVFISPFLGEFGEKNPGVGKVIGALPVVAALIYSPDALMGMALAPQAVRSVKRSVVRNAGTRGRDLMARGYDQYISEGLTAARTAVPEIKTIEDAKEFESILFKYASRDRSGAAQTQLALAGLGMGAANDLQTAARAASKNSLNLYDTLKTRATEFLAKSEEHLAKATEAADPIEAYRLKVDAAQDYFRGVELKVAENNLLVADLTKRVGTLKAEEVATQKLWSKELKKAAAKDTVLSAAEAEDLLKVSIKKMSPEEFMVKYADDTGRYRTAPNARTLQRQAAHLLRQHLKSSPGDIHARRLETIQTRLKVAERTLRNEVKKANDFKRTALAEGRTLASDVLRGMAKKGTGVEPIRKADLAGDAGLKLQAAVLAQLNGFRKIAENVVKAEEQVELAKALDDTVVTNVAVKSYEEYLQAVRRIGLGASAMGRIADDDYAKIAENIALQTRGDVKLNATAKTEIREAVKSVDELVKLDDDALIDTLFQAKTATMMWKDPYGFAHLEVRSPQAAKLFFQDFRAWTAWAAISLKEMGEHYTFFKTNVRFLDVKIRRDIDDEAKATARRTQDLLDGANLILDNIDDPAKASEALRDMLTSGGMKTVKSRWNLPFTPRQEVTLSGLVGLDESLARMATRYFVSQFQARKALGDEAEHLLEMADDVALNAAIKAFVKDKTVIDAAFFKPTKRGKKTVPSRMTIVKNRVSATLLKNLNELENASDKDILELLETAIKQGLDAAGIAVTRGADAGAIRSKTLFYKAIILGAMQKKFTDRFFHIVGPRFNSRMAQSMNYFMGAGRQAADEVLIKDFEVGDYVILRSDSEKANMLLNNPRDPDFGEVKARFTQAPIEGRKISQYTPEELEAVVADIGTARNLAEWMAKNAVSDTYRRIANRIAKYVPEDTPVSITRGKKGALGSVSYANDRIVQFHLREAKAGKGKTGMSEDTIIHELLHAATVQRLGEARRADPDSKMGKDFTKFSVFFSLVKNQVDKLTDITPKASEMRKALGVDDLRPQDLFILKYGVSNDREFLTNFFANPAAQRVLEAIRDPMYANLFNHGTDLFGDLFNVSKGERNAFSALVRAKSRILDPDYAYVGPHANPASIAADMPVVPARGVRDWQAELPTTYTGRVPRQAPKGRAYKRMTPLERETMEAMGAKAARINKIEGDRIFLNDGRVVSKAEVVHRDIRLSIMDAVDGFSLLGMETLGTLGRQKVNKSLRESKATYARMVAHSVDAQGNVRMLPQGMLQTFNNQLDNIVKELDEAISEAKSTYRIVNGFRGAMRKMISWWKQSILFGLIVPRPAYFMNQWFGDMSQMILQQGWTEAAGLSLAGAFAYVPFYGKALQNSYIEMGAKMTAGKTSLPPALGAFFNPQLDKILRADDTIVKLHDGDITAAKFYGEAIEDGIGEFLRVRDFGRIIQEDVRRMKSKDPGYFEALANAGYGTKYVQRTMELKIREVTRRQRLLLYSHLRVNKRMSREMAKKALHDTMYDWTYSVSRMEREMLGEMVLFYTLTKNAFAQVFRTFFEGSDIGTKEFLRQYVRGNTRVQRLDLMSRLSNSPVQGFLDPETALTPEQAEELAIRNKVADWMQEYPILALQSFTPEQIRFLKETGGYYRTNMARIAPKATPVEYAVSAARIFESIAAIGLSMGDIVDPEGKVIPFSANRELATKTLLKEVTDEFMVPVYGDVTRNFLLEALGLSRAPKSEYGRRLKPGDMTTISTLQQLGLANVVQDARDETKRVTFDYLPDPLVDAALVGMLGTEINRLRMGLGILFPESRVSPVELRVIAMEGGPNAARLQGMGNFLNFNRAMFYNGTTEAIWTRDAMVRAMKKKESRYNRMANTPVQSGD